MAVNDPVKLKTTNPNVEYFQTHPAKYFQTLNAK